MSLLGGLVVVSWSGGLKLGPNWVRRLGQQEQQERGREQTKRANQKSTRKEKHKKKRKLTFDIISLCKS
jgi:hypothetical protein